MNILKIHGNPSNIVEILYFNLDQRSGLTDYAAGMAKNAHAEDSILCEFVSSEVQILFTVDNKKRQREALKSTQKCVLPSFSFSVVWHTAGNL